MTRADQAREYLRRVRGQAARVARRYVPALWYRAGSYREDYLQDATLEAWRLLSRWEPDRAGYWTALWWALRGVARLWAERLALVPGCASVGLDSPDAQGIEADVPEPAPDDARVRQVAGEAARTRSERAVVAWRLLAAEPSTLADCGHHAGCSRQAAQLAEVRVLSRMREALI
jgi:DNA-directed RNA polymerase specialized sigma24 family protein